MFFLSVILRKYSYILYLKVKPNCPCSLMLHINETYQWTQTSVEWVFLANFKPWNRNQMYALSPFSWQVLLPRSCRIRSSTRWRAPQRRRAAWRWSDPAPPAPPCCTSAVLASASWCPTVWTPWTCCRCRQAFASCSTTNWVGCSVSTVAPERKPPMGLSCPPACPRPPRLDRPPLRATQRVAHPTSKPVGGRDAAGRESPAGVPPSPLKHWQTWMIFWRLMFLSVSD